MKAILLLGLVGLGCDDAAAPDFVQDAALDAQLADAAGGQGGGGEGGVGGQGGAGGQGGQGGGADMGAAGEGGVGGAPPCDGAVFDGRFYCYCVWDQANWDECLWAP